QHIVRGEDQKELQPTDQLKAVPYRRLALAYANYLFASLPSLIDFFEVITCTPAWQAGRRKSHPYNLPQRKNANPGFVKWLSNMIRQAMELKIMHDTALLGFLAIWTGSLDFFRFAVSRLLGVNDGNHGDSKRFSPARKQLRVYVNQALIDAVKTDNIELREILLLHPLLEKDFWSAAGGGEIFHEVFNEEEEARFSMLHLLLLLSVGFNVNFGAGGDKTPLIYAIEHAKCMSSVNLLLERGVDPLTVDYLGRNALHYVAGYEFEAAGHVVMEHALSNDFIDAKDSEGRTPLSYAIED
ncbi:hypothetical protein HDU96_006686, partial [Phlyctochytrium bullatum]